MKTATLHLINIDEDMVCQRNVSASSLQKAKSDLLKCLKSASAAAGDVTFEKLRSLQAPTSNESNGNAPQCENSLLQLILLPGCDRPRSLIETCSLSVGQLLHIGLQYHFRQTYMSMMS